MLHGGAEGAVRKHRGLFMRLLIYGAGVIGGLYAAAFSGAGYDTTVFARGKRLEVLEEYGLRYEKKGRIDKAKVSVIKKLGNNDRYNFIFLPVKENQAVQALEELRFNVSPNIVTMVNTLEPSLRRCRCPTTSSPGRP